VPVDHTCNPSFSGDRDQEVTVQSQPGQIFQEILSKKKKKSQKRAGGVVQGVGPKFNPSVPKKKKKERKKIVSLWRCSSVVQHLPSKTLGLISSTTNKTKKSDNSLIRTFHTLKL
jgi:hypothetical protein